MGNEDRKYKNTHIILWILVMSRSSCGKNEDNAAPPTSTTPVKVYCEILKLPLV